MKSEFQLLSSQDIDRDKWNDCVLSSISFTPYALDWYLDAVGDRWSGFVREFENQYLQVMPFCHSSKWGIKYVYQPLFIQQLGSFSRPDYPFDPAQLADLMERLKSKFKFIDYTFNEADHETGIAKNYVTKTMNNFVLPLSQVYEINTKGYTKNRKRDVKKAQEANLEIVENHDPKGLISLFERGRGNQLKSFSKKAYQTFSTLVHTSTMENEGTVYYAKKEGEVIAGMYLVNSFTKLIFIMGATSELGKKTGAMTHLIDYVINQYSETNKLFDFEGSNDENVARFYKSFGARQMQYPYFQYNKLSWPLKWLKS